MIVYKIRDKNTGKFSSGNGVFIHWVDKGKVWQNKSGLINHIKDVTSELSKKYNNAEIVVYETKEIETKSIEEFLNK